MSPRLATVAALLVLTCACSADDVGLGPTAGSAAEDTPDELVERLEATDGVVEVDYETATGESDSGEPGTPAELALELDADVDVSQVTAVLGVIEAYGRVPGAEVTVGPDGASVIGVDDGAPVERGAEVLLAATDVVTERGWDPAAVDVLLEEPVDELTGGRAGPFVPALRITLPAREVADVTDAAEALAADSVFDAVDIALYPSPAGEVSPSLVTGREGVTAEVLARWADVRRAVLATPPGLVLLPSYGSDLRDGTDAVDAALVLDDEVARREVTVAAYGEPVRPALCALAREAAQGPPGSTVGLSYDGDVLVDITVDGPNPDGTYGRRDWNRFARTCPGV